MTLNLASSSAAEIVPKDNKGRCAAFLAPMIGKPWAWQSLNCWDFAFQVQGELFGRVLAVYEQMCDDYPQSAFAHNSLGWLCANCRRRLDLALSHAQTAVKLEPKAAGYLDTLAEIHFRRGEKDKAIELMKQCRTMEPKAAYYRKQLERFAKGDIASDVPEHDDE